MGRRRKRKPFDLEDVEVIDAASDGRAVVRSESQVVFVPFGVPGDRVDVNVFGRKKKMSLGRITKLREASPDRVDPECQHFGVCGGCKWQNMAYDAQLRYKEKQVRDAMERLAKVPFGELRPILGAESPYWYRNKLEFSFAHKAWLTTEQIASDEQFDAPALGFHVPGVFDKVLDIETCWLQLPVVNDIRNAVQDYAQAQGWPFYNAREHTGLMRELMFRSSRATGELLVLLILAEDSPEIADQLFTHLAERFPAITSFVWMHNPKKNSSFSELPYTVWRGPAFVTEQLGGYQFHISPTSFFQTNTQQAETLYGVVQEYLRASLPTEAERFPVVYDLYSGTGSIGIFNAEFADKIVGVEYVDQAVEDAARNVALNGLEGKFSFHAGDMKNLLTPDFVEAEGAPDLVITDPPRAGMDPAVVDRLLEVAPRHIIYVSCKPSTQARDIARLAEKYEVVSLQPVDMFPHTAHVENVAWLRRR